MIKKYGFGSGACGSNADGTRNTAIGFFFAMKE
jgi:hypothetical protein